MRFRFEQLGLPPNPLVMAPLAGITDFPFRLCCQAAGADLCYVEMISAIALCYGNRKTLWSLTRHKDEPILGVQLVGKEPENTAKAVTILNDYPFDTIDLNMGCPAKKVCKNGGGSAILQDVAKVYRMTSMARQATDKPLSVKIRIGWDRAQVNAVEVADAIERAGADWLTVHGRTRSETYAKQVDLDIIRLVKSKVKIPVIGNGNILSFEAADYMRERTAVDGLMVARGALGNPFIFRQIRQKSAEITLDEWFEMVQQHLVYQAVAYGDNKPSVQRMRKHILWYTKGWPYGKKLRENIDTICTMADAHKAIDDLRAKLESKGVSIRPECSEVDWERLYIDTQFQNEGGV